MTDWDKYGPIYTVSPGIKKIANLPIIEFDSEKDRYLNLKSKASENIYYDNLFSNEIDNKIVKKIKKILSQEYPKKNLFSEISKNWDM